MLANDGMPKKDHPTTSGFKPLLAIRPIAAQGQIYSLSFPSKEATIARVRHRPASVVLLVLLVLVLLGVAAFFGVAWYSEIDPSAPPARSSFDPAGW